MKNHVYYDYYDSVTANLLLLISPVWLVAIPFLHPYFEWLKPSLIGKSS